MTGSISGEMTDSPARRRDWKGFSLRAAVIFLAAMFVYIPAMQSRWIWDDNLLITQYVVMQRPDGLRIFWFPWTDADLGDTVPDYYPITWSTLWLEWRLWGDYPPAYHVSNCVMHAISAVLVWRVLVGLSVPGAFLAGLIFAVHPVNVCSVAWVSERKNTVSIIFFLLTLLFYFKFDRWRRWYWYVLALVMFVLALLSKASVVTLPVVLLLGAWWRRGRGQASAPGILDHLVGTWQWGSDGQPHVRPDARGWRYILADLVRTVPFFLLGAAASWLIVIFQIHRVIRGEEIYLPGEGTIWWRLAMAGSVPWFYLYKALLPLNLLMIYPRWDIHTGSLAWFLPGVVLVASAVVLLCLHRRAWARHLIFALGYFLVLLLPTLGFFDMYFFVHSLVADHWQHLSIIGVIALVVGVGTWAFQRRGRTLRWGGIAAGAVVVGALGVLTWNQTLVYHDQIVLWRYNLPKNPKAWMGQYNLGTTLAETAMDETDPQTRRGVMEEALVHLLKATELRPTDDAAQNNAGLTLMNLGRLDEAISYLQRAVQKASDRQNPQAAMNLSLAYRTKGSLSEALKWAEEARSIHPQPAPSFYLAYAETLAMAGRPEDSVAQLTEALRVAPSYVELWYRRGLYRKALGRADEALADFQEALRLQNNAAPVLTQIGLIAQERGHRDDALDLITQAVLSAPGNLEARYRLGLLLLEMGRDREAATHLGVVVQADPSHAEGRGNLALALLRSGQTAQAIAEYRKVLELQPNWTQAQCDLARLLAHPRSGSDRNVSQAVTLAEAACQTTKYEDPRAMETLAMVYSEAGRFDEAAKVQRRVLELVTGKASQQVLDGLRSRLELYQSHKPFSAVETAP
ncbi:MAG: tetratricopeptide repeat protein [Phycisphaerae bacterium]|nr:tetratricopeptide repeat protein [Phycisphaerae bacterium]